MPLLIGNLTLKPGEPDDAMGGILARRFRLAPHEIRSWRMVRKALDARKKGAPLYVCTVEFETDRDAELLGRFATEGLGETAPSPSMPPCRVSRPMRVVVVGMGPAGLFAALRLLQRGMEPVVIDRGASVAERVLDVEAFWRSGILDPESNVQFGEGGAGTFSDGKLTTRVRDVNAGLVLETLVAFGAPPEIRYLAKPHVGTDRLRGVLAAFRRHLLAGGAEVRFRTRLTDLNIRGGRIAGVCLNDCEELACDAVVLAPGNSARDTFQLLLERGVAVEAKPFAVGLRVEHPQEVISRIQYGANHHPQLPPADYALTARGPADRPVYSFCMCPGGVVVAGSSEEGGVVTNGMSHYRRDAPAANSALVVAVSPGDFGGSGPLAGIDFQRQLERRAFFLGGGDYRAPAQSLLGFLGRRGGTAASSYRPGTVAADLGECLPTFVAEALREGLNSFDRKMRGFISSEATLTGVETRTSSPVRILRGDDCQSLTLRGLYPAGEGAGYAGGIMSSALDGIRVADALADRCLAVGEGAGP
jgi:hypothetical protein